MSEIEERLELAGPRGLRFDRRFTTEGVHPYDEVEWEFRDARLTNFSDGSVAFEQRGVEFPTSWSVNATNIVAQKYFRGKLHTPERESSLRQVIDRVVQTITQAGRDGRYFEDERSARIFEAELTAVLLHQRAAFNSPVWFNIGVPDSPRQASACFILSVDDTMDSILNWYVEEGIIFKGGSGAGANLSRIRSSKEQLSSGGEASGPVSFMRGADASAGTIKSGGKTRRAAKMVILNADHPDVIEFIWCKALEERKARVLRDAGFDMDLNGKDGYSMQYQNANNSVRVTDEFMRAVISNQDWALKAVMTGETLSTLGARDLLHQMSEAAWECADPGLQYDTTINRWHTCPESGRINGSNPCSEYVHLDNSACNLASINLLKFLQDDGTFDVGGFTHTVDVVLTAQEILVGYSSYPTEKITENAKAFRQLGLGYANLGALLMAQGLPYDSDEGRAWAASITALMTGRGYRTSAEIASRIGPFDGFPRNREAMTKVMRMHRDAVDQIDSSLAPAAVLQAARSVWDDAITLGGEYGWRNAQATVLAPTGCLVGGTLVATERGVVRLGTLGDPFGQQWQDLGIGVLTDDGPREATRFYVNGLEPVVTVTTRRGHHIKGTPRHRIKVVDAGGTWAWRHFADIQPGDRVPLSMGRMVGEPQEVLLPPLGDAYWTGEYHVRVPRTMTSELAELVGYFMGDGSRHSRGLRLCVAAGDFDVVERLRLLAKGLFNIEVHTTEKKGYTEVALHSVRLVQWWDACGFTKKSPGEGHAGKGYRPYIPDAVLYANDREIYAAFVRGLFEADGTVTVGYPSWSTTDFDFSGEVQALLLTLGYATTRKVDLTGWGKSRLAVLRLLNRSHNPRFVDDIGFISSRKNAAVNVEAYQQSARYDHIPVSRELVDRVAPENDRLRKVALTEVRRDGSITRRLAEELAARRPDAELTRLLSFFYDEVGTAELGDEELTYDLSVPDNVTYVANGFISHNTISFMMDCDTTGIEPDLALIKHKKLVAGGNMEIINQTVPRALDQLGYHAEGREAILAHLAEHHSIIGAPALEPRHYPVFATSMGDNAIHYIGHVKMMSAVQPFISGAISKTVNVPEDVTVADIEDLFIEGWRMGLKAVAIYRDNSKVAQPLSAKKKDGPAALVEAVPQRKPMPRKRPGQTIKFRIADCEGFLTAGEYPDDGLGEVFLKVAKQGSTLEGIMNAFAVSVSMGLQYGVPLESYVRQFINTRFEPAGITDDQEIRFASSIVDYIFRRLAIDYLPPETREEMGIQTIEERQEALPLLEMASLPVQPPDISASYAPAVSGSAPATLKALDAPMCHVCGDQMRPAGSCYACQSCGATSGCS